MSAIKQITAVAAMNVRAISSRLGASLVIVLGMAAVVGVVLSVLSMSTGLLHAMNGNSDPLGVIVLSRGAPGEGQSSIARDAMLAVLDTAGIRKGADGKLLASAEITTNFLSTKKNGVDAFACARGVTPNLLAFRPEIKLLQGRMFTPGLRELIAGKSAVDLFDGFDMGAQVRFSDGMWTVVGVFEAPGGFNSCMFGDAETMMTSFRRNTFNMIDVRLEDASEATFQQFKTTLTTNPVLSLDVEREHAYWARAMQGPINFYAYIAYGVGGIMSLGAIFAALNTMYAAVSSRAIEIATLRAIGFGAGPVVISIMIEALALAVGGAAMGALAAWLAFNGRDQVFNNFTFNLAVTPGMLGAGILMALGVGALAALFPAIRAARLPVATALKVR